MVHTRKGEIAFSTFVSLVIAAAILILIMVWLLPNYTDVFRKTDKISENVGVTEDNIRELKCKPLCEDAQGSELASADTEFCKEAECSSKYDCSGVDCSVGLGGEL